MKYILTIITKATAPTIICIIKDIAETPLMNPGSEIKTALVALPTSQNAP